MIDSVNTLTLPNAPTHSTAPTSASSATPGAASATTEDPMSQIAGVLNGHLSSLKWIDDTVWELDAKVKEAEMKVQELTGGGMYGAGPVARLGESSSSWGLVSSQSGAAQRQRGFGLGASVRR